MFLIISKVIIFYKNNIYVSFNNKGKTLKSDINKNNNPKGKPNNNYPNIQKTIKCFNYYTFLLIILLIRLFLI